VKRGMQKGISGVQKREFASGLDQRGELVRKL